MISRLTVVVVVLVAIAGACGGGDPVHDASSCAEMGRWWNEQNTVEYADTEAGSNRERERADLADRVSERSRVMAGEAAAKGFDAEVAICLALSEEARVRSIARMFTDISENL